jgi:outer membrane protein OmpA-like peptidoglycan-associated protein
MSILQRTLLATAVVAIASCASTPKVNPQLEQAKAAVQRAQNDPATVRGAALDLQKAQDSLRQANDAQMSHKKPEEVTHLAYLATQQANVALAHGEEKTALASIDKSNEERSRVQLQAREAQAQAAQTQAQTAQAQAEQAKGEAREAQLTAAQEKERSAQLAAELNAKQTERGMVLTLGDVLFDTNKAQLKPGATRSVDRLAQFLKDNPKRTVRVEGYTDSTGSEDHNQELSERRAQSVREAIIAEGIQNDRVQTKGFGENYAVAGNETAAGRQQNRRVEVVISDDAGKISDRS